jgi:TonB family protein
MNTFLTYMLKSSLYLVVFYTVYNLLLSRDTAYTRNRIYLLLSVALAFILPLVSIHLPGDLNQKIFGRWLNEIIISGGRVESGSKTTAIAPNLLQLANSLYIAGVIVLLIKYLADLGNLLFLIIRKGDNNSRIVRHHSFKTPGFSAMGYVFISSELSGQEAEEIIKHERNHLKKNHFADLLLTEFAAAFQWFNPAAHLLVRSLKAVHEYEADKECLQSGSSLPGYQQLLLRQIFRSGQLNLSNSFVHPSLTRKRMIMMTKRRSSSLANLKVLAVMPFALVTFLLITASSIKNKSTATLPETTSQDITPFVVVEEMPQFPGGDVELLKYIGTHALYPEKALENKIEGRVIVRFCVTETGGVSKISVLQSASPILDEEAMRVVAGLPRFKPGRQAGVDVPVWYMVPVTFTLK